MYPVPVKWCSHPKKIARAEDVLISVRAPVGPTNLCPEQSCIGRGLAAIRPLAGMESRFLLYLLRHREPTWASKATGTTFKAITGTVLKGLSFPLPPLAEQQRIVNAIETHDSQLDAGVSALKTLQSKLERYRAAVLKAACEGTLLPSEEVQAIRQSPDYEPAGQLLQRILAERRKRWEAEQWRIEIDRAKQKTARATRRAAGFPLQRRQKLVPQEWQDLEETEYGRHLPKHDQWEKKYKEPFSVDVSVLPELPDGWVWASVQQLSTKVTDGTHHTPTYTEMGVAFISVKDIRDGRISFEDCRHISEEEHSRLIQRCHPETGDVLITKSGTIGRVAVVRIDHPFSLFVSVALMKTNKTYLNQDFFKLALEYHIQGISIDQDVKGGVVKNLHLEDLRLIPMRLPPLTQQHRIVAEVERRLSVADDVSDAIATTLRRADRLRQSILKEAFAGRLVPQDPNDEPASVLLKRIQAGRKQRAAMEKRK
jgi:type I restriction enzyme S subunit